MLTRILLAGVLASTLAFAQRGGGGRGGDLMPNVPLSGTRIDRIAEMLKLSKDQKRDVKAAMDNAQKEAAPVHEQLVASRLAVAAAVAAGKSKEELDKAILSEAQLDTQMMSIELHAFAKAAAVLEGDQKPRGIAALFATVRGAFNGKNWNTDPLQP